VAFACIPLAASSLLLLLLLLPAHRLSLSLSLSLDLSRIRSLLEPTIWLYERDITWPNHGELRAVHSRAMGLGLGLALARQQRNITDKELEDLKEQLTRMRNDRDRLRLITVTADQFFFTTVRCLMARHTCTVGVQQS